MLLTPRGLTAWTLANIAASTAFIWLTSWTWLEPNLRGEDVARGGDALVWMVGAFPVLAVSAVGNMVWLALVWRERRQKGLTWPVATTTVVAAVWISALIVDHFRGLGF
jgi:hypothetical protein